MMYSPETLLIIPLSLGDENNFVHVELEEEGDGPLVSHMCH